MAGMTAAERYDDAYQKMLKRVQLELADEHATPSSRLDTLKMRRAYLRRECISAIEAAVAEERARCVAILDDEGWLGDAMARIHGGAPVEITASAWRKQKAST